MTYTGYYAFDGCTNLKTVRLTNAIKSITSNSFSGCISLSSISLPPGVTYIEQEAFSMCKALSTINIPDLVETIHEYAFYGCSGLTNINIPNSVTSIGGNAFSGCSGLTRVYISNSVETIASETFKDCSSLATVTIPNSVTTIGRNAFYGTALTSIVLGSSVNKIEDYAFSTKSSYELDRVVCTAVAPPLCGNRVFNKSSKARLFVPAESIERYKKANVWSYFQIISDCSGVSDVGADDAEVMYDVYDMRGVRVAGGLRETEANAERLPRGVYILVSPQGRKKLKI